MKNTIIEMSEIKSPDGRRNIKMVLHSIYNTEDQWNKNGITYLEEYTQQNIDSVKGLPLCVAFFDENKEYPSDHGFTEIKDGLLPLYEDSVQVGSFYYGAIEDVLIDGETQKVLVGYGYVNQSRYPAFVEWLERQVMSENTVVGSVEFVGKPENDGKIIYRDGWKEQGRIPVSYLYSGHCILNVEPADDNAIMLEFNQLNNKLNDNKNNKNKEGLQVMDEKQMEQLIVSVKSAVAETNAKNDELTAKIAELNESIAVKDTEIENLNSQISEVNEKVEEKDKTLSEVNELVEKLQAELNECKKENAINELNQAISQFTEEEKNYAKDDINLFNEDYTKVEVNSIVMKINAGIGAKTKEAQITELNAVKNQPKLDDIFSFVDDVKADEVVDLDGIFE